MKKSVTVREFLFGPCSRSLLADLSRENGSWALAERFIEQNETRIYRELRPREQSWIYQIKKGLLRAARL